MLSWQEEGGPPVRPPNRKGFGTTIIDRSVPYDLGGKVELDYDAAGVQRDVRAFPRATCPNRNRSPAPAVKFRGRAPNHPSRASARFLAGRNVLLVEDSLIIALDAEDILERLGADDRVHRGHRRGRARLSRRRRSPTLAILDINLGDRTSFADRRPADWRLGVPFLFATGYGEQAQLPIEHRSRPVVQKPYTLENVASALADILS